MSIDTSPPAFPLASPNGDSFGMSLRDWFAGQAMIGLLQNENAVSEIQQAARAEGTTYPAYAADIAYYVADAMLAERDKP